MQEKDHDLLIRLDQKMDGLTEEFRFLRDNYAQRLADVEHNKVDVIEFQKYKDDEKLIKDDYENRMRRSERWILIATGALLALQFIIKNI